MTKRRGGRKRKQKVTLARDDRPVIEERLGPTPELEKKRKAGVRDEKIDELRARDLITDIQEQAFRKFAQAHAIMFGKTAAKVASYADRVAGGAQGMSEDAILYAKQQWREGDDALRVSGHRARDQVLLLVYHNHYLPNAVSYIQIGLDALADAYGLQQERAA